MSLNFIQISSPQRGKLSLSEKKYNVVTILVSSFLIGASTLLHISTTAITSLVVKNLCQIRIGTVELAALERPKNFQFTFNKTKCCDYSSAFIFKKKFFFLGSNKDKHEMMNEFKRTDPITNYKFCCLCTS